MRRAAGRPARRRGPAGPGRTRHEPATLPAAPVTYCTNAMSTDLHTIRLACAGDERAMRALWAQYSPVIDAVVRRLVGDPDHAADVAQEVWIQIFRALPSYRGEAQFSTWAHRIAVNRTLNALRRLRRLDSVEAGIQEDSAPVVFDVDGGFRAAAVEHA